MKNMCKFIETSKEFNDASALYAQALGTLSASVKKEKLERAQKLIDKTITDEETKIGNMELVMATISAKEKASIIEKIHEIKERLQKYYSLRDSINVLLR